MLRLRPCLRSCLCLHLRLCLLSAWKPSPDSDDALLRATWQADETVLAETGFRRGEQRRPEEGRRGMRPSHRQNQVWLFKFCLDPFQEAHLRPCHPHSPLSRLLSNSTLPYCNFLSPRPASPRRLRLSPVPRPAPNIRVGRYHHSKEENLRNGKEKREDPTKIAARSPIRNPWSPYDYTALQNVSRSRDPSPGMSPRRFTLGPQPEQSVIRSTRPSQRQQSVRWVWAVEARAGREVCIQRFETNLKHRYRATKYKHDVRSRQTGA
ncbi:hypothetical protein C8035_v006642 [Colletotrichum spinosum]|uniref:Uncharacterized protein n=1 Tax=Colletotrichum spinosum TaxID=1347390 RepID=A0A4R8Q1D4_9PEZI|nr:hypothetical protein C8035_v006642 [Colletotrichum spinosum]